MSERLRSDIARQAAADPDDEIAQARRNWINRLTTDIIEKEIKRKITANEERLRRLPAQKRQDNCAVPRREERSRSEREKRYKERERQFKEELENFLRDKKCDCGNNATTTFQSRYSLEFSLETATPCCKGCKVAKKRLEERKGRKLWQSSRR